MNDIQRALKCENCGCPLSDDEDIFCEDCIYDAEDDDIFEEDEEE